MGRLGDLLLLDALLFLCLFPVITVGPGLCASYYVCFKLLEDSGKGTLRDFFHSFRMNFVQGVCILLIMLFWGAVLFYDARFVWLTWGSLPAALSYLLLWVCGFLTIVYLIFLLYIFPLQARFYNKISVTVRNAFLLGVRNLPRTLLMLLADGVLLSLIPVCLIFYPQAAIIPILFSVPASVYINSRVLRGVLGLKMEADGSSRDGSGRNGSKDGSRQETKDGGSKDDSRQGSKDRGRH